MPIIALSSMVSPAAIERGRQAGFHDYVAKFDRPGLIAALKEQTAELEPGGMTVVGLRSMTDDQQDRQSPKARWPNTSPP